MTKRGIAFLVFSTLLAAAFVAGFGLGARITARAAEQVAGIQGEAVGSGVQRPALDQEADHLVRSQTSMAELEARAESALDEIRALWQGVNVLASWYAEPYHGRRAADGSIYNKHLRTAAHRTLPFGTLVLLEREGRIAVARITDRGPYIRGRQIDLSFQLARDLGMVEQGIAVVRMTVLRHPEMMVAGRASEED